jgi:hypothetical protein
MILSSAMQVRTPLSVEREEPTGQIIWTLVNGDAESNIMIGPARKCLTYYRKMKATA